MTAWMARGTRLDIELSVALEIATLRLKSADSAAERRDAIDYNLQLWRIISRLASTAPIGEDRERLVASAEAMVEPVAPEEMARHNVSHARVLAGRAATNGALRRLLDDWNRHRGTFPNADFANWIIDRMDDLVAAPVSVS